MVPARMVESSGSEGSAGAVQMSPPASIDTTPPAEAPTLPSVTACVGRFRLIARETSPAPDMALSVVAVMESGRSARPMLPAAARLTLPATMESIPETPSIEPTIARIDTLAASIPSRSRTEAAESILTAADADPVNDRPIG